jgi:hypothetical protein
MTREEKYAVFVQELYSSSYDDTARLRLTSMDVSLDLDGDDTNQIVVRTDSCEDVAVDDLVVVRRTTDRCTTGFIVWEVVTK